MCAVFVTFPWRSVDWRPSSVTVECMHHQDLTLIGPAGHVDALRTAFVAAGGTHVADCDHVHVEWRSEDGPAPVEALAGDHPDVDVRMRRVEDGSDVVQEVTICAGRVVVDRARRIFREADGEVSCRWGLSFDEDGERLDPVLLRRVADDVLATNHEIGSGRLSSAIFDALLLAEEAGRFARAVDDPLGVDAPSADALGALRRLAAVALTVACASTHHSDAEMRASRTWRMREVLVHAGYEELWSEPGQASWPEWIGYVLTTLTDAIDACLDCGHAPVWVPAGGDEGAHGVSSADRRREAATGGLVSTCVQALALFAGTDVYEAT